MLEVFVGINSFLLWKNVFDFVLIEPQYSTFHYFFPVVLQSHCENLSLFNKPAMYKLLSKILIFIYIKYIIKMTVYKKGIFTKIETQRTKTIWTR